MNPAYVIATSLKLDIASVDVASLDDEYFSRKNDAPKEGEDAFFKGDAPKQAVVSDARKADQAKVDGKPLVSDKKVMVKGSEKSVSFSFFNSIFVVISVLLFIVLINKRFMFLSYLFVCGILGIFLCLVGLYSQHQEVLWNYNALLFSPLFVLLPFIKGRFLNKIVILNLFLLLIYIVVIITKPYLVLMIPFILTNLYILLKLKKKSQEKLLTSVE